jgi:hypothetical protein
VRFNEDSTLLLMFFPIMIESRKKYKINYIKFMRLPAECRFQNSRTTSPAIVRDK